MHGKSDSDVTSLAASSPPRSPKRPVYFVRSPSRDSQDDCDKSSSMHATPVYNSPMESPSHPSTGTRHSRASSASRFSGRSSKSKNRRSAAAKPNDKGWPECGVILEEGPYEGGDTGLSRRFQALLALLAFVLLFATFCLIIWAASRHYQPEISQITVKSISVNNFYFGEGSDGTGVPTKLMTVNCSLNLIIHNPASTFGIHVTSGPVKLLYSQIPIATGQLPKHYQPRKSRRIVSMIIQGEKVPLYGAGAAVPLSSPTSAVPLTLDLEIYSRAYAVGKLVKVKHRKHISCPLEVDSSKTKPIEFSQNSCTYD